MLILGLCDSQNSGAVLFNNSKLIAAVNEERLNRIKLWGGFPDLSIKEVLRIGGVKPEQIEKVVIGTSITPNILARAIRSMHQKLRKTTGQFGYLLNLFITYQTVARKLKIPKAIETMAARAVFNNDLKRNGINCELILIDHHLAHAYGAWATSPFEKALIVTVDGLGDGLCLTVNVGEKGKGLDTVYSESGYSAITLYYSRLTEYLGFKPIREEGKVNALAANTDKLPLVDFAKQILHHKNGRFNTHNYLLPESPDKYPYSELKKFSKEEIAASFQRNLENEMKEFVRYWMKKTGTDRLALGGGLFANVKLNQRLMEMPEVKGIYIFPQMGDGGLGAGGVFAYLKSEPAILQDVFLGPDYSDKQILESLEKSDLEYIFVKNIHAEVAKLLAQGKIVARFTGKMEYGPRALGHRTILVNASDSDTINWLNLKLKRTGFMPFAPAILDSEFDNYFINGSKAQHTSKFMNISLDVTEKMKKTCPGAVHTDGTARPQRVCDQCAPDFAAILQEYQKITGIPVLINTSFNMHEEPIVNNPDQAIEALKRAKLDYLAMGNYIISR